MHENKTYNYIINYFSHNDTTDTHIILPIVQTCHGVEGGYGSYNSFP